MSSLPGLEGVDFQLNGGRRLTLASGASPESSTVLLQVRNGRHRGANKRPPVGWRSIPFLRFLYAWEAGVRKPSRGAHSAWYTVTDALHAIIELSVSADTLAVFDDMDHDKYHRLLDSWHALREFAWNNSGCSFSRVLSGVLSSREHHGRMGSMEKRQSRRVFHH